LPASVHTLTLYLSLSPPPPLPPLFPYTTLFRSAFPHIHITVGGNVITRLQEELPNHPRLLTEVFDSAIMYEGEHALLWLLEALRDRKSTRLNSSHVSISYAVFCLKKKN